MTLRHRLQSLEQKHRPTHIPTIFIGDGDDQEAAVAAVRAGGYRGEVLIHRLIGVSLDEVFLERGNDYGYP